MQIKQNQFKQWITQHHQALYRHALWMTSSPDSAEDLVQDTYYQAWKYRVSLRDESKVLPWLLTILRRLVFKESKLRSNRPTSLEDVELDSLSSAPRDTVDQMIDLERELSVLSISQREILLLHALHGFTYEEISEQLDIPTGTVMSRLSRARKAMSDMQVQPKQKKDSNVVHLSQQNRRLSYV